jgi:arsenite methyltransferase
MPQHEIPGVSTHEEMVRSRYSAAAQRREDALCCPTGYSTEFLSVIPDEILERDYGCGDPTSFVQKGETVLDLGSGGGKLCYILAQVVGKQGRVIGVDCNQDMLGLARKYRQLVEERVGFSNVEFRNGLIQDLQLDLDVLGLELAKYPVCDADSWLVLRNLEERLRSEQPMIADASVDCVVSNCVLNLVRQQDRRQLFAEIFRVLKPGGRAAISDIVADNEVPESMESQPELWSGCLSGAFQEQRFLAAFEEAGFHGIQIANRQSEPWRTVNGIEFRSVTVVAFKAPPRSRDDRRQTVIYRGPFKQVLDEEGNCYPRGARVPVSGPTIELLQRPPYAGLFDVVESRVKSPGANCDILISPLNSQADSNCCSDKSCC